jgi:hypothetical protein
MRQSAEAGEGWRSARTQKGACRMRKRTMGEPLPFLVQLASQRRAPRARAGMGGQGQGSHSPHSPHRPHRPSPSYSAIPVAVALVIHCCYCRHHHHHHHHHHHYCHHHGLGLSRLSPGLSPTILRPAHRLPRRPPSHGPLISRAVPAQAASRSLIINSTHAISTSHSQNPG